MYVGLCSPYRNGYMEFFIKGSIILQLCLDGIHVVMKDFQEGLTLLLAKVLTKITVLQSNCCKKYIENAPKRFLKIC